MFRERDLILDWTSPSDGDSAKGFYSGIREVLFSVMPHLKSQVCDAAGVETQVK